MTARLSLFIRWQQEHFIHPPYRWHVNSRNSLHGRSDIVSRAVNNDVAYSTANRLAPHLVSSTDAPICAIPSSGHGAAAAHFIILRPSPSIAGDALHMHMLGATLSVANAYYAQTKLSWKYVNLALVDRLPFKVGLHLGLLEAKAPTAGMKTFSAVNLPTTVVVSLPEPQQKRRPPLHPFSASASIVYRYEPSTLCSWSPRRDSKSVHLARQRRRPSMANRCLWCQYFAFRISSA